MRIKNIIKVIFVVSVLSIFGCGGGGGGSTSTAIQQDTIVSGVATNASGGTVKVTALNADGTTGSVLKSGASVDATGHYTINLGSYTGPILVEAAAGNAPVYHSAVQSVSGIATVVVSPLTELAFLHAGTALTSQNIASANTLTASLFNVSSITSVVPVNAATTSLTSASSDVKNYSLAIATITQPGVTIADVNAAIASNTMSSQMAVTLQNALNTFLADSSQNKSGIVPSDTSLPAIGTTTVVYKLSTQGSIPAGSSMRGVQLVLNIPVGYSIKTSLAVSGIAPLNSVISSSTLNGKMFIVWTPASDSASISTGLKVGEFASIAFTVAPGTTSNISLADFKASDDNGAAMGSISAVVLPN